MRQYGSAGSQEFYPTGRFDVNGMATESPIFPQDSPAPVSYSGFVRPRMTAIAIFATLDNGGFLRF
jgi:hypothetical protein